MTGPFNEGSPSSNKDECDVPVEDRLGLEYQLGFLYYSLGETQLARERIEQALVRSQTVGRPALEGELLTLLGVVEASFGKSNQAREILERAKRLSDEHGPFPYVASTLLGLGRLLHRRGQNDEPSG